MPAGQPTPLEQLLRAATSQRSTSIGLPAPPQGGSERRFPLTPEAAGILVDRGFTIKVESGAADLIHYDNAAYNRQGVAITDRAETLRCDIVISLPAIREADVRHMRRGALLLTFSHYESQSPQAIKALLAKSITTVALDRIGNSEGQHPFADILREIDGRAAIAIASSLLADAVHGKGILLGGVAGIVPCEVTVIGADLAGLAAVRSVMGLGATARLFDDDVYRLRRASDSLGPAVITSALHPRVFESALRTADIVVASTLRRRVNIGSDLVAAMKRGVIVFDLEPGSGASFPSLATVDLAEASATDNSPGAQCRICYVNAGSAVPRTAAMALSNALLALIDELIECDSAVNALKLIPGLRGAAMTFLGKPVDAATARLVGCRPVDISLLLQFS